jgi:hypothetical protein
MNDRERDANIKMLTRMIEELQADRVTHMTVAMVRPIGFIYSPDTWGRPTATVPGPETTVSIEIHVKTQYTPEEAAKLPLVSQWRTT